MCRFRFSFWSWSCVLSLSLLRSRALELDQLFPFGEEAGDQQLKSGSDSTAELSLNGSLLLFSENFHKVYINTNGFVSVVQPPAEKWYLGKMPASFKMVAPLLGDLDTSDGRGRVYFREDADPSMLSRATAHVRKAFLVDDTVKASSILVVTWENVAAAGTSDRGDGLDVERNTFQLVVVFMPSSTCAILLYPAGGLQFLSTVVAGHKHRLEAGFNEGMLQGWFFNHQGVYFRTTTNNETSIAELGEKTNAAQVGVWVYEMGATPEFVDIRPGNATMLPWQQEDISTHVSQLTTVMEGLDVLRTQTPVHNQTGHPKSEITTVGTNMDAQEPEELVTQYPQPETNETSSYNQSDWDQQTNYNRSDPAYHESPEQQEPKPTEEPEQLSRNPEHPDQPKKRYPDHNRPESTYHEEPSQPEPRHPDQPESTYHEEPSQPEPRHPDQPESTYHEEPSQPESRYPDQPESTYHEEPSQPESRYPDQPESTYHEEPSQPEPRYPDQPKSTYHEEPSQPESRYHEEPSQPESRYYEEPSQPEPRYPDQPETTYHEEPEPPKQRYHNQPDQPVSIYPDQLDSRHQEPIESTYHEKTQHPNQGSHEEPDQPEQKNPDHRDQNSSDRLDQRYQDKPEPGYPQQPSAPETRHSPVRDPVEAHYTNLKQPQIVVLDEDDDLDVNVFAYNLDTCQHNRHKCSAFAECRDHRDGYCCHCRTGFYGSGRDCVAEGKAQRMNGKVLGRVSVGFLETELNSDLHAYIVANEGRAYVAVSNIPDTLGPSLLPLSSLGGVIGWAFALEQPGFHNGFRLIGGVFSCQGEVIFQPGNERLSIKQEFHGINEHEHLVVSTRLEGQLPAIELGSTVHIGPYQDIYSHHKNLITSSSQRHYTITSPNGDVNTGSYEWRETITFHGCPHDQTGGMVPSSQQLTVDQIFVMFDAGHNLTRSATSNKIGSVHALLPEQNPCLTGRHGCDVNAICRAGPQLHFTCDCASGFFGDGLRCQDVDECQDTLGVCGQNAVCINHPGSFRCKCVSGFVFAIDGTTCVDVDECETERCHKDAVCSNTPGSFRCQCRHGYHGDGVHCSPASSEREKSACERERESAMATSSSYGFFSFMRRTAAAVPIPQCDEDGSYRSTQCHESVGQCWCVDAGGREITGTRTTSDNAPLCIQRAITPTPIGPTPRPDVHPVTPGTHILFAQSGKIELLPLDQYGMKKNDAKVLLHVPDRVVIALAFDCLTQSVYWSDITAPAISKAHLGGGDVVAVVTEDMQSPEGLAIDHVARLLFWTDSVRDTVEVSKLDGSQRRVLFDTDLVNPRAIVTNPAYGQLFWTDWDRDGPKIEMSNMDGSEREVLVEDKLGLPNALTFDFDTQQLCWADAGSRKVECLDVAHRLRRQMVEKIQYPFAAVSVGRTLYYTDWRREAVVAVDLHSGKETDDFLPQKRSRLYGITTTTTRCPQAYNVCADNGGCGHLCLPRLGGFTCHCPDDGCAAAAAK
uniref:nidogen-1-like n=1 Tax=Doryrhamphus excisus TaxID=161450 RepID=UPI0025ADEE26|nr:nidogen-1-like [Doryrhamphus excisus]